jgi:hypothetical protein
MLKKLSQIAKEDAPANAAGSGNVAGMGVPPGPGKGEPGVPKDNKYKRKNLILGNIRRREI